MHREQMDFFQSLEVMSVQHQQEVNIYNVKVAYLIHFNSS